jgi:hypothetical protein
MASYSLLPTKIHYVSVFQCFMNYNLLLFCYWHIKNDLCLHRPECLVIRSTMIDNNIGLEPFMGYRLIQKDRSSYSGLPGRRQ